MRNFADVEISDCRLQIDLRFQNLSIRLPHFQQSEVCNLHSAISPAAVQGTPEAWKPPAHEVGWLFFRRLRNNGAAPNKSKRGAISRTRVFPREKLEKSAAYIHAVSAHAQQST
jgi:hypothetical protein